jgi:hypothetical protein
MTIGDMVQLMRPWCRMKIASWKRVDVKGNPIWTDALTEAQKLAYWNHNIIRHEIENDTMTIYCLVEENTYE